MSDKRRVKKKSSKRSRKGAATTKRSKIKSEKPKQSMYINGVLYNPKEHKAMLETWQNKNVYNRWGSLLNNIPIITEDASPTTFKGVLKEWRVSSLQEFRELISDLDPDVQEYFKHALNRNVWHWSNYVSKVSYECSMEDPENYKAKSNRLVVIPLSTIFLGSHKSPVLFDAYIKNHSKSIATALHTLGNIGRTPGNVRVLFYWDCVSGKLPKPRSLTRFFRALGYPDSKTNGSGILLPVSEDYIDSIFDYGTENLFLIPDKRLFEQVSEPLLEYGYKIVCNSSWLTKNNKTIRELKESRLYKQVKKSWGNTKPVVCFPEEKLTDKNIRLLSPLLDLFVQSGNTLR